MKATEIIFGLTYQAPKDIPAKKISSSHAQEISSSNFTNSPIIDQLKAIQLWKSFFLWKYSGQWLSHYLKSSIPAAQTRSVYGVRRMAGVAFE